MLQRRPSAGDGRVPGQGALTFCTFFIYVFVAFYVRAIVSKKSPHHSGNGQTSCYTSEKLLNSHIKRDIETDQTAPQLLDSMAYCLTTGVQFISRVYSEIIYTFYYL